VHDLALPRDGSASRRASDEGGAAHIDQPGTIDTGFGSMPGINQYLQLVPWLFLAFFPLFYLMASQPRKMMQYLFSAIFVAAMLSLDESGQS